MKSEVIDVGSRKQLFIDEKLFECRTNVRLTVQRPIPTGEVLIKPDKPWERLGIAWLSVLQDDGLYRIWYSAYESLKKVNGKRLIMARVCYAYSEDGVHWIKPNLGRLSQVRLGVFSHRCVVLDMRV